MFSPTAVSSTLPARNPRRRQRASEDSSSTRVSVKRRKRSSISSELFEPLVVHKTNGNPKFINGNTELNGHAPERKNQRVVSSDATSIALRHRGSKRGDREIRGSHMSDGAVQTKNDNYVVTQDTNLPEALRTILSSEPWRAFICSSLGYAVTLTRSQAIVWRYESRSLPAEVFKPLVLKLPFAKHSKDDPKIPLPLGMLVNDSGAGELALLVIMPNTGQLIYWESVSSAANAEILRQKPQGIQSSVGGLLSGEVIVSVTEAEPDGFILASSTGRVSHLSVRDPQGRLSLSTQYLRNDGNMTVGFLGGLKNVFSSAGWRRDIAAIRATPVQGKGRRQFIVATTRGSFQVWDLLRHSTKSLSFELETREEFFQAVAKVKPKFTEYANFDDFSIKDFAIFPGKDAKDKENHRLLVLTGLDTGLHNPMHYDLIDVNICAGSLDVNVIHSIKSYHQHAWQSSKTIPMKIELLLPQPAQTAFVVTDNAVVIMSLAKIEQSPDSQLRMESHLLSDSFQDVIYLKQNGQDEDYHVVECSAESPTGESKDASVIRLLVHGFGMARISALPAKEGQSTSERAAVTMRSKMEQNIFFGNIKHNLLDLRLGRQESAYSASDVDSAALEINKSIMECTSPYIPAITPSMDYQLKIRATALADLMKFAKHYKIRQSTRWQLLWSAEKMAAARALWHWHSSFMASKDADTTPLLPEVIDMLSEHYKHENQPERGETDIVRHYLIHDIPNIELLIVMAHQSIEELRIEKLDEVEDQVETISTVSQASSIQIECLQAAFSFRETNAEAYGIGKDVIEDGIYQGEYGDLPHIWTSWPKVIQSVNDLANNCRDSATTALKLADDDIGVDLPMLLKLANDCATLVKLTCQVYEEGCRWLKSRSRAEEQADGEELSRKFVEVRRQLIVDLMEVERQDAGVRIAEKYGDMEALVDILTISTVDCLDRQSNPQALGDGEEEEIALRLESNRDKQDSYFNTFGDKWATAFFTKQIVTGNSADLLQSAHRFGEYIGKYLRERPDLARLSWLHETTVLGNYSQAADDLQTAEQLENNLWSKKIELSLSKLAIMAAEEKNQIDKEARREKVEESDIELTIISIQEQLHAFLRPSMRGAIDAEAQKELVMDALGGYVADKPTLRAILLQNVAKLGAREVLAAEDLADTLTLVRSNTQYFDDEGFSGKRFFLALKVLMLTGLAESEPARFRMQERIIWRRVMIQDDWTVINRTEEKSDMAVAAETEATALFQTLKAGFAEGYFNADPVPSPQALRYTALDPASVRSCSRYAHLSDDIVEALVRDFAIEDGVLERCLEGGRLQKWWSGVIDRAAASVRMDRDEVGKEMARKEAGRRSVERRLGLDGPVAMAAGTGMVHGGVDAEGDVVMG